IEKISQEVVPDNKLDVSNTLSSRRFPSKIGSHPPTCIKSCETCTPCTPILVSGPPPESEVWKCKCKDKLYNPIDPRSAIFSDSDVQIEKISQEVVPDNKLDVSNTLSSRRFPSKIGSHPPTCIKSCETCTPCTPILVSGPPPESEVWKCKCKDKCAIFSDSDVQIEKISQEVVPHNKLDVSNTLSSKRFPSKIGSHPPTCIKSCETCTPCTPILVSGPPPESEVWKCKCKD
ncbi:hypothetical protein RYX36_028224, partial [Vicia faba]